MYVKCRFQPRKALYRTLKRNQAWHRGQRLKTSDGKMKSKPDPELPKRLARIMVSELAKIRGTVETVGLYVLMQASKDTGENLRQLGFEFGENSDKRAREIHKELSLELGLDDQPGHEP